MDIDLQGGWNNVWYSVADTLPRIIVFLVILLVGWLVAKGLSALTNSLLERTGFDRMVERSGLGSGLARSRLDASDVVAMLVYWAVILITLTMAFGLFGPNPISALLISVIAWLPQLALAIVIVVVAAALAAGARSIVQAAVPGPVLGRYLGMAVWAFIVGLGVIAALNQIGVAVTVTIPVLVAVLATVSGVIIVGVGGGLIRPMQERWSRWLLDLERQVPREESGVRRAAELSPEASALAGNADFEHHRRAGGDRV